MTQFENLTETFRREVLAFIREHGFSGREFSTMCGLSVNFVSRLQAGVVPRTTTVDRVRRRMAEHRQEAAE